ncbi:MULTISPECIES: copper homeostasis protein CutC [unclassified Halanaerobium]|uniref:copper homeostasis protein CutC n=1 Tax=unclassified Halanaerobium TaxID=2641197 RepID=UPI000DF34A84|nr:MULTISPECIES: copper homeostasis protein CutC [unclassified Halanaerobium]RCW41553.1 copper homeostasis protein [Halanaerobium sp. MA284_MarDTE_T2]RCW81127.1 copper homeostasis protein [Halanaerobium sp. DL-01]
MKKTTLEICCASAADAVEAEKGGADRIELNSAMVFGGLTPSIGDLIEAKKRINIPVVVMIRPRSGGFCCSEIEFEVMKKNAEKLLAAGADGIVFGILKEDGSPDIEKNKIMRKIAGDKEAVFHRAFDIVSDPFAAVDQLTDIGIDRILTSGQQAKVEDGLKLAREIINYAGDRIEVLLGGGIREHNVKKIILRTGAEQIHLSAFKEIFDNSASHQTKVSFNGLKSLPENKYKITDSKKVKAVKNNIS